MENVSSAPLALQDAQKGARHTTSEAEFCRLQCEFWDLFDEGQQAKRTLLKLGLVRRCSCASLAGLSMPCLGSGFSVRLHGD